jgi:hypothetical protein
VAAIKKTPVAEYSSEQVAELNLVNEGEDPLNSFGTRASFSQNESATPLLENVTVPSGTTVGLSGSVTRAVKLSPWPTGRPSAIGLIDTRSTLY